MASSPSEPPTALPDSQHRREVRSFVRREGRTTGAQLAAIKRLWPRFGIPESSLLFEPSDWFNGNGPLCLEIGFGDGTALAQLAASNPDCRFIGLDVYKPGFGRLLRTAEHLDLSNLRVCDADAVVFLRDRLGSACLDEIYIWFPDPWPKKRHHKRRLVQPPFVELLAERLKAGGTVWLATDSGDYAKDMLRVMEANAHFENQAGPYHYASRCEKRPLTTFERKGLAAGNEVFDLAFRRK
jgi:tRNA (guanine-N7-)-methyltransferase